MSYWYCIHTRPKHEDIVEKKLLNLPNIDIINPKIKVKKYVRYRLVEVVEHLFPCYIFSRFDKINYFHMIKYTRGVRKFVGASSGWPFIVDDNIVELIKSRMKNGHIHIEQRRILPGDSVKITEGPLKGLSGILLSETKASERVMVLLSTLHYQGRVRVLRDLVAKA
jgi:transcriptional antiterminator RfaH